MNPEMWTENHIQKLWVEEKWLESYCNRDRRSLVDFDENLHVLVLLAGKSIGIKTKNLRYGSHTRKKYNFGLDSSTKNIFPILHLKIGLRASRTKACQFLWN